MNIERIEYSRRDTTHRKASFMRDGQLTILDEFKPGSRSWVRQSMSLRIAESTKDRSLAARIIRERHYLAQWPVPPNTKMMSYLVSMRGLQSMESAGLVTIALLAGNCHAVTALRESGLEIHPCSVLTLVRMYRCDDMNHITAPDFTPEMLRRVVKGSPHPKSCPAHQSQQNGPCNCSPTVSLMEEWCRRKLNEKLYAIPRVLMTYADPANGHDGYTYASAGATFCGPGKNGKWCYLWALDDECKAGLVAYGEQVKARLITEGWSFIRNQFPVAPTLQ